MNIRIVSPQPENYPNILLTTIHISKITNYDYSYRRLHVFTSIHHSPPSIYNIILLDAYIIKITHLCITIQLHTI